MCLSIFRAAAILAGGFSCSCLLKTKWSTEKLTARGKEIQSVEWSNGTTTMVVLSTVFVVSFLLFRCMARKSVSTLMYAATWIWAALRNWAAESKCQTYLCIPIEHHASRRPTLHKAKVSDQSQVDSLLRSTQLSAVLGLYGCWTYLFDPCVLSVSLDREYRELEKNTVAQVSTHEHWQAMHRQHQLTQQGPLAQCRPWQPRP